MKFITKLKVLSEVGVAELWGKWHNLAYTGLYPSPHVHLLGGTVGHNCYARGVKYICLWQEQMQWIK